MALDSLGAISPSDSYSLRSMTNPINVSIVATDDEVYVRVGEERFEFSTPGMLTGSELRDVLEACGIQAEYDYAECDCGDRSWYGDDHDSACPVTIARNNATPTNDPKDQPR
jgi:hypothetical protein